jgi:hypothetical protein
MADNTCFYIMMSNWIRKYNQNQNTFLYTVDSAYLQSLFVRENFAIKRTLR